jgi:phage replication initiation protein
MTRPSKSALVLDGSEVKIRLLAERAAHKTPVHVDWVRFTTIRRNNPAPALDTLFPKLDSVWTPEERLKDAERRLPLGDDFEFTTSMQAFELAGAVALALGPDFTVNQEFKKGHDFYKFRWSIERNGHECGWVGFLSSGDSPRQQAQSQTIHCNLFGAACTFAQPGWNDRIADLVDDRHADLTRCDLALDFFDGYEGGIQSIQDDYKAGLCNVGGKKLKCNMVGDWCNGQERSFYIGSKEAGKQTNAYEKGDQLFGPEANSNWLRIELRYGNKLRVLSSEMLRRPADFFAGASDWHALALIKADYQTTAEKVRTIGRLPAETVHAEVARTIRWTLNTAAACIATVFQNSGEEFLQFVTNQKLPGRLRKFAPAEIKSAFDRAFHHQTVDSCPAFV